MDIMDWPLDRIMTLPDCCFGRKYVVSCAVNAGVGATVYDISELHLPDGFVLWQLMIYVSVADETQSTLRLALGDRLPTAAAEMNQLEPLINGFGEQGLNPRYIRVEETAGVMKLDMRMPFSAGGRSLVIEAVGAVATPTHVNVAIVISSIPKEVPDWLISGTGKNL